MKAIKSRIEKDGIVHIEVTDEMTVITHSEKAVDLTNRLEEVGTVISDVCRTIHARLRANLKDAKPNEFTLEFGIKLAGETGVPLITNTSVDGTFQVKATWKLV